MNNKIHIQILSLVIGLLLFFSCETHVQDVEGLEELNDDLTVETCDPTISYQGDIKPILTANCLGCHSGSQAPNLSAYQGVSANADRVRFQVVNGIMPQGGSLTNEEIEFIRCWIDSGALNN